MPKTGFAIGSTPIDYLYENEGYDLEACKRECVERTDCVAVEWNFDYQACILYSEYGETLEDSNHDIYTCEETGGMLTSSCHIHSAVTSSQPLWIPY